MTKKDFFIVIIGREYQSEDKFDWAVGLMNLIVGYFLFSNHDVIVSRLKQKAS